MNIYVGNLPFRATDADLADLFGQHGSVTSATVMTDRETGRARGFGFVEMADAAEANKAIQALSGADMGGRQLVVNEARAREERTGGYGSPRRESSHRPSY